MVSTYWAELPARLIRHADATGRLVRSPGRLPLPTETASAFLQTSAAHFGLAAPRQAGGSTPGFTSCA